MYKLQSNNKEIVKVHKSVIRWDINQTDWSERQNWPISLYEPDLEHSSDKNYSLDSGEDFAQVIETSCTTSHNSPSHDFSHPVDQTTLLHVTPGLKSFTVKEWQLLT